MANGVTQAAALALPLLVVILGRRRRSSRSPRRSGAGPKELDPVADHDGASAATWPSRCSRRARCSRARRSRSSRRSSGQVASVFVDAGDRVKKGQLLLQLDPRRLRARRRGASARPTWPRRRTRSSSPQLSLQRRKNGLKRARRGADRRRHSPRTTCRRKKVALQTARGGAATRRSDQLRYTHIDGADGRHGHRARHPAGRGRDAGRAGDVRGQGALDGVAICRR